MTMARLFLAIGSFACLAACIPNQTIPNPDILSGTALKPPVSDLAVGTLFYTKDTKPDLNGLVSFLPLCTPDLANRGFPPPKTQTSLKDIDLLANLGASGELSGLEIQFTKLGLTGGINRYFEYKLTNVEVLSYDAVTAKQIFDSMDKWDRCKGWRETVPGKPIFQIPLAYRGDLTFSRKNDASLGADVSAKIASLEPKLKLALKNATQYGVSGKALFVVVEATQRQ